MKKVVISLIVAIIGIVLLPNGVQADVNNFTINSFSADYYLGRDTQQRSTLRVVETITVTFPDFDQNHGILRAIPETYQGHPLDLKIQSVTNGNGQALSFDTSTSNDNKVLKIGDANRYVHGLQQYVISYTMRDVTTRHLENSRFYWDINGDQWPQNTQQVTARLHIDSTLVGQRQGAPQCYTGSFGLTMQQCHTQESGDELVFATTTRLAAYETMTVVVDFQPQTFAAYQISPWAIIKFIALFVLPPLAAVIFIILQWRRHGRDPKSKGTIVPEYTPPKDESVLLQAGVWHENIQGVDISAQLLDLAIRGYIKVYEVKKQKLFFDSSGFELEVIRSFNKLRTEEQQVIELLFDGKPSIGDRIDLSELKNRRYKQAEKLQKAAVKQLVAKGYLTRSPVGARLPYILLGIGLLGVGIFTFPQGAGVFLAGLVCLIGAIPMPSRTAKGVAIREHLKGLKMYMELAEAERLRVMQSPHGTLTPKINITDKVQLVKLYEKLLPYAIIFAIEKQWAQQFAELYAEPPTWYSGVHGFQAATFIQSLSALNHASSAVFASPSSSGGDGSAGGGGGGGGGGGW